MPSGEGERNPKLAAAGDRSPRELGATFRDSRKQEQECLPLPPRPVARFHPPVATDLGRTPAWTWVMCTERHTPPFFGACAPPRVSTHVGTLTHRGPSKKGLTCRVHLYADVSSKHRHCTFSPCGFPRSTSSSLSHSLGRPQHEKCPTYKPCVSPSAPVTGEASCVRRVISSSGFGESNEKHRFPSAGAWRPCSRVNCVHKDKLIWGERNENKDIGFLYHEVQI